MFCRIIHHKHHLLVPQLEASLSAKQQAVVTLTRSQDVTSEELKATQVGHGCCPLYLSVGSVLTGVRCVIQSALRRKSEETLALERDKRELMMRNNEAHQRVEQLQGQVKVCMLC